MAKKKSDSSVGYVEPGMTLILGVKEGEWRELKQYRDEGIFYQTGTSLIAFSLSLLVTLLTASIADDTICNVLWVAFGLTLGAGLVLLWMWRKESKHKNNVVKRVERRAIEQYGDQIGL